jgi:DNA polymerase-1
MLLSLLKEKPDYFVIAWDSPTKTIRKQIFKEYKANRPELPDNFKRQIKNIKEIINELNLPNLSIP